MNMNEGLDNLISEVGTILGTELPVQRRHYYEGARDYLATLKRLLEEEPLPKKRRARTDKKDAAARGQTFDPARSRNEP